MRFNVSHRSFFISAANPRPTDSPNTETSFNSAVNPTLEPFFKNFLRRFLLEVVFFDLPNPFFDTSQRSFQEQSGTFEDNVIIDQLVHDVMVGRPAWVYATF